MRVVSHPRYRPDPLRASEALDQLRRFCESGHHHFWADALSLTDGKAFNLVSGRHRQVTDVYLLGLAVKMGGELATFDRTIPRTAVKQARADQLAVIEAR